MFNTFRCSAGSLSFELCGVTSKVYLTIPASIYLLKVNNRNTRTYFIPCSSVSIVNFEHVIAGWD